MTLLGQEANLQTSLDAFKVQLGLPPEMEVRLDDTVLQQFQLNDPRLDAMRTENDARHLRLLQIGPAAPIRAGRSRPAASEGLRRAGRTAAPGQEELRRWQIRLEAERKRGFSGPDAAHDQAYYERRADLSRKIEDGLDEWEELVKDNRDKLTTFLLQVERLPLDDAVKTIRDLVNKQFRSRLSEVFAAQTRIRVFLIELKPVDLTVDQAIQIALANRLDLKNALALVTDTWRNVEVDANALRGFLNFIYNANFASAPDHATLFRFDSSASIQQFGFQFQAPINRRAERNQYRLDQIQYQRARRAYMLLRDQIVQQIRLDMRELTLNRKQFDIGREQILSSSIQVEQAEDALLLPLGRGRARDLEPAQRAELPAHRPERADRQLGQLRDQPPTLHSDFDLMDIDGNGVWTNENDPGTIATALRLATEAPSLSLAIPARIPDLSGDERRDKVFFSDVRAQRPAHPRRVDRQRGRPRHPRPPGRPGFRPSPDESPRAPPPTPSPFAPPARP